MPKKNTAARSAAEERHEVKRHVSEHREKVVREYEHLPIKAVLNSIAELLAAAGDTVRIPYNDTTLSLREVLYMQDQEVTIREADSVIGFIEGMSDRDNARLGGQGRQ